MGRYDRLLAPGRLGPLKLRNRIAMCPMGDTLGDDGGFVSDRQVAYYEARARGGAALILVGSVSVAYPYGTYNRRQLALSDDVFVDGLRKLTDAVHAHGALIAAQLVHDGPNSLADIEAGRPLLVPSIPQRPAADPLAAMVTDAEMTAMTAPFTAPTARLAVKVAEDDDLAWVIERFADAARRAEVAGFDGIEIHAGHGYLLDAFLSPASNRRDDQWGGAIENRARLLTDVIAACRAAVSPATGVWIRFNGEERHRSGGESRADGVAVARLAVAAGAHALHVSAYADAGVAVGITDAHTPHEPGALVELAAAVKAVVDVPVITFGRLEPEAADDAIAAGHADFVAFGRKLLADPDLPRKLAADRVDDIRPCIYAYRCIGNIFLNQPVGCVSNAATAHESEPDVLPGDRRILVVGGGPAGLEAARLLASAGHRVTLWEAGAALGGRLQLAARCDATLDRLLGWLRRGVDQAGVAIELGRTATAADVEAFGADSVIVATGGAWSFDESAFTSAGPRVAVLGSDVPALGVAEFHARRGCTVSIHDDGRVAGAALGLPGRFRHVHDLQELGVEFVLGEAIDPVAADTVIDARPAAVAPPIAGDFVIGDAREIGFVEGAMRSALDAAVAVSRT